MKKIDILRAAMAEALPEFKREPHRLVIWIENGTARSTQSKTLGFGFSYRINLLLVETNTDLALITLALFRWLRVHQPDLLRPNTEGISFDADILDNSTSDIRFELLLTENVTVTPLTDGGWHLDYLPEPDPLFDDETAPCALDEVPLLADITLGSEHLS